MVDGKELCNNMQAVSVGSIGVDGRNGMPHKQCVCPAG